MSSPASFQRPSELRSGEAGPRAPGRSQLGGRRSKRGGITRECGAASVCSSRLLHKLFISGAGRNDCGPEMDKTWGGRTVDGDRIPVLRRRNCCISWGIPHRSLLESFRSDRKWRTRASRGAFASFTSLVPQIRDASVIPSLRSGETQTGQKPESRE